MLVAVRHTLEVVVHVCEELLPPESGMFKRAQLYLVGPGPGHDRSRRLHLRDTATGDAMCGLNQSLLVEADPAVLWEEAPTELRCPACGSTPDDQLGPGQAEAAVDVGTTTHRRAREPEADPPNAWSPWLPVLGFGVILVAGALAIRGEVPSASQAAGAWVPAGVLVLVLWASRYTGIGSRPDDRIPMFVGMLTAAVLIALIQTARAVFA